MFVVQGRTVDHALRQRSNVAVDERNLSAVHAPTAHQGGVGQLELLKTALLLGAKHLVRGAFLSRIEERFDVAHGESS